MRKAIGLTQKELAEKSGVKLRMIQQYEQRAKDINKATASNLFALAQVLGCKAEDLLEQHVLGGGDIRNIVNAFGKAINESDFFKKMLGQTEKQTENAKSEEMEE